MSDNFWYDFNDFFTDALQNKLVWFIFLQLTECYFNFFQSLIVVS